jgi:hypothetical protein
LEQKLLGHWILFALGGFVSLQTDPRESVTPYDYDYDYDCDYDYDYDYTYCRGLLPGHSLPLPQATPFPSCLLSGRQELEQKLLGHWTIVALGGLIFFQIVFVVILDDLTTAVSLPTKTDSGERRRRST